MSDQQVNDDGPYGYVPTQSICIVFLALFGVSGLLHLGQAIRSKLWWMIPTMVVGCLGETIGWAGRLWSSQNPHRLDPFLMQITTTIMAPSFMSAANFTILGLIINQLGTQYSRLTPRWYLIIFIALDLAALTVQSIGGARASQAAENNEDADPGGRIMLGGIILQMVALTAYVILGAEFLVRFHLNKPVRDVEPTSDSSEKSLNEKTGRFIVPRNVKIMLAGLVLNTVFLFIRTVYRTIELNDGWDGSIITNQTLFNTLDGLPIVLATFIFNIIHPGYFLRPAAPALSPS